MKKYLLTSFTLLFSLFTIAQNYPGEKPELLLNKQLKVLPKEPNSQQYGYREFFSAPTMNYNEKYIGKTETTPYNELVGKIFTVTEVVPLTSTSSKRYRLTLKSEDNQTVYYRYDPEYDAEYYFEVIGGLKMPDGYYCEKIESKSDGLWSPPQRGMMLIKDVVNGKPNVMIRAIVWGSTVEVNKKGMTLTLQNGKIIKKPSAEIDVAPTSGKFKYSTVASLTKEELKLLSESPIVKITLFTFSEDFNDLAALSEYAKCFLK